MPIRGWRVNYPPGPVRWALVSIYRIPCYRFVIDIGQSNEPWMSRPVVGGLLTMSGKPYQPLCQAPDSAASWLRMLSSHERKLDRPNSATQEWRHPFCAIQPVKNLVLHHSI